MTAHPRETRETYFELGRVEADSRRITVGAQGDMVVLATLFMPPERAAALVGLLCEAITRAIETEADMARRRSARSARGHLTRQAATDGGQAAAEYES